MSITIVGLHPPRNPDCTPILTLFDVKIEGLMTLRGCALVERDGVRTVWGPPLPKTEATKSGVGFTKALRLALTEAVSEVLDTLDKAPRLNPPGLSAAVALVREVEARQAEGVR